MNNKVVISHRSVMRSQVIREFAMRNNLHLPPSCAKTTLQVNLIRLPPLRSYLYPPSVNQRVENNKIATILSIRALRLVR